MASRGPNVTPYAFSHNNPVMLVDPDGNWPKWFDNAVASVGASLKGAWNSITSAFGREEAAPDGPSELLLEVEVIREANKKPSVLWKWNPEDVPELTNVVKASKHLWSIDDEESAREETRLLYVAMTRAKNQLLIFIPENHTNAGAVPNSWADLIKLVG